VIYLAPVELNLLAAALARLFEQSRFLDAEALQNMLSALGACCVVPVASRHVLSAVFGCFSHRHAVSDCPGKRYIRGLRADSPLWALTLTLFAVLAENSPLGDLKFGSC